MVIFLNHKISFFLYQPVCACVCKAKDKTEEWKLAIKLPMNNVPQRLA